MKVLEFKHIGPFDGCFCRWEYLAVDSSIDHSEIYPIIFTEGRLTPDEVLSLADGERPLLNFYWQLFKDFTWFEWTEELWGEIPHPYVPAFRQFAVKHGLEFAWWCDKCGEPQGVDPLIISGLRKVGGPFMEPDGWLCSECAQVTETTIQLGGTHE